MAPLATELAAFLTSSFGAIADPARAAPVAAYMKSTQPFYGIPQPQRVPVYREIKRRFTPTSRREYESGVLALWKLPHREAKYTAIAYAMLWPGWVTVESIPLYELLIREGAWWDVVDTVAIDLVGAVQSRERDRLRPIVDRWVEDDQLWIRRSAILSQIKHKQQTNADQLFDYCLRRAAEAEFFIRKAIGWALRDYSHTNPTGVKSFLLKYRNRLSGLSFREGGWGRQYRFATIRFARCGHTRIVPARGGVSATGRW